MAEEVGLKSETHRRRRGVYFAHSIVLRSAARLQYFIVFETTPFAISAEEFRCVRTLKAAKYPIIGFFLRPV